MIPSGKPHETAKQKTQELKKIRMTVMMMVMMMMRMIKITRHGWQCQVAVPIGSGLKPVVAHRIERHLRSFSS